MKLCTFHEILNTMHIIIEYIRENTYLVIFCRIYEKQQYEELKGTFIII